MRNSDNGSREYYSKDDNRFDYNRNYNNEFYGVNNQYNNSQVNNNGYNNSYTTNNNYNSRDYSNSSYTKNYENNLHNQNRFDTEKIYVKSRKKGSWLPLIVIFSPVLLTFIVVAIIIITSLLGIGEELFSKIMEIIPILIIAIIAFIIVYFFINKAKTKSSKKQNCKYNIKGLVIDVRKVEKSTTYYIPIIMYCFMGKEYIINDDTQYFNCIEIGTEIDMRINQNNPEEFYIEMIEKK
ncbi:MAG: hypothetical protein UHK60_10175 [Acutalibacteraceae bacterium]|nr:hypothetical protein [Acutalibacteraceae bacterium]